MGGTLPAGARHDLTDEQWTILTSVLESLLPVGGRSGRPRRWTLRQLIDGIRFRTRTGCPWRDVPERYGSWQPVYGLFRTWQLAGRWAAILTELQALADEAGLIEWVVSVDSTITRAHQHAAGARGSPPRDVPVERLVPQVAPGPRGNGRVGSTSVAGVATEGQR